MPDRVLSGRHQKLTAIIAIVTALLWLTSPLHGIPAAVIALLAAGMFFGLHLLDNEDLKGIEWSVLVLMWGGLSLGKGLEVTGLTTWLIEQSVFQQTGFVLVMIFSVLGVLLGTFMSHTATANLLIPIVLAIPGQNNIFLAVAIALACSFAMALPISTPPNAIAFATKTLKVKDMFVSGMIISVVSLVVMLLGYKLVIGWAFGL
jgi:sodium-dependent dicarboxylate transporter 2/3/5